MSTCPWIIAASIFSVSITASRGQLQASDAAAAVWEDRRKAAQTAHYGAFQGKTWEYFSSFNEADRRCCMLIHQVNRMTTRTSESWKLDRAALWGPQRVAWAKAFIFLFSKFIKDFWFEGFYNSRGAPWATGSRDRRYRRSRCFMVRSQFAPNKWRIWLPGTGCHWWRQTPWAKLDESEVFFFLWQILANEAADSSRSTSDFLLHVHLHVSEIMESYNMNVFKCIQPKADQ